MADVVDSATRSRMMSAIKGRNTRPEIDLRKALHAAGFRYRLHGKDLPGRPDIVLGRWRCAVFVHGCFWHRHEGCHFTTTPATRPEFWQDKFLSNVARDRRNIENLLAAKWRVAVVWECSCRKQLDKAAHRLARWIRSSRRFIEIP